MSEQALVAALAPIFVGLMRKAAAFLDKSLPSILFPAIAPVMGVLSALLLGVLGIADVSSTEGAAAGLMGIGLREIIDQSLKFVRN